MANQIGMPTARTELANKGIAKYRYCHADRNLRHVDIMMRLLEACNDEAVIRAVDQYHERIESGKQKSKKP